MPKRADLHRILVIGSGPIVIGQAAEFDYSGYPGREGAPEEGYEVMLVNSNPATIMTDPEIANRTYIEPVTPEFVELVIARERPDALLPTMGGQTALNVAMELAETGVLERYGVELIGAKARAIAGRGSAGVRGRHAADRPRRCRRGGSRRSWEEAHGDRRIHGLPGDHPAVVHVRRVGWRHRLQPRGVRGDRPARARRVAGRPGADRAQRCSGGRSSSWR